MLKAAFCLQSFVMLAATCGAVLPAQAQSSMFAQSVARPVPGDPLQVESGKLAGKLLASGVRAYFGIPYVDALIGERRWRAPQPAPSWPGIYHADRMAPECMQPLRAHKNNQYLGEEAISEDCLYLNVWAPAQANTDAVPRKRPVLVYIHGGGFVIGSGAMPLYAGESLAQKGLVFVNFNYRLGALGTMAHPALTQESPHHASGNYGLLDQIAALRWVRDNIARFGGDPANVTIAGQSAGSMSVSLLHASPLARGLFHKAVGMSGAAFGPGIGVPATLAAAEQDTGLAMQQALKAASLAAMRDIPADRILQASLALAPTYNRPVIDGHVLPALPEQQFTQRQHSDVPLLLGFTRDETFHPISFAKSVAEYRAIATQYFGVRTDEFLRRYPSASDTVVGRVALDAGRDATVSMMMRHWAKLAYANGKAPVHAYFFERAHSYLPGVVFGDMDPATAGAYHTAEVPFWFQTLDSFDTMRPTRAWTAADRLLAAQMSDALVAFATDGRPATPALPWNAWEPAAEQMMKFGESNHMIAWPNRQSIDFLAPLANAPLPVAPGKQRD